jgi:hypothetical protein
LHSGHTDWINCAPFEKLKQKDCCLLLNRESWQKDTAWVKRCESFRGFLSLLWLAELPSEAQVRTGSLPGQG